MLNYPGTNIQAYFTGASVTKEKKFYEMDTSAANHGMYSVSLWRYDVTPSASS